jgi:Skp family chaperone for outer membrane proteins
MTRHIALIAALFACVATIAHAQETAKVAVVNPARAFQEMKETKDLKQKLENDRKSLEQEVNTRKGKVTDLQSQRDLLKPDSPQYAKADQDFMQEAIQFDTWSKITSAQLQGQQKQQMKTLFDKIVAATSAVAQQKQIDLVIADQRPDLPENLAQISVEQMRAILNGRNVIYNNNKADITNDVIAQLDSMYTSGGGGTTAPAPAGGGAGAGTTPAPAPAPAPGK